MLFALSILYGALCVVSDAMPAEFYLLPRGQSPHESHPFRPATAVRLLGDNGTLEKYAATELPCGRYGFPVSRHAYPGWDGIRLKASLQVSQLDPGNVYHDPIKSRGAARVKRGKILW